MGWFTKQEFDPLDLSLEAKLVWLSKYGSPNVWMQLDRWWASMSNGGTKVVSVKCGPFDGSSPNDAVGQVVRAVRDSLRDIGGLP